MAPYRWPVRSLVLISAPAGINDELMASFCRDTGSDFAALKRALETEFACHTDDYRLVDAMRATGARILMLHDEDDEEVPVSVAKEGAAHLSPGSLVLTKGLGHGRILASRDVLRVILAFLRQQA